MNAPSSAVVYLTARVVYAFCWTLMTTLSLVFMVVDAGLDPFQMVLVGTVLEASTFLFEVPTGVVADVVSRRLSVIVGHVLVGLGFLLLPMWPTFAGILVAQVIWGMGWTFISGAFAAWLTGEVGVGPAAGLFLRASQLTQVSGLAGIGAAVGLGHVSLGMPIAAGAVGVLGLAVWLALAMRETAFEPAGVGDRPGWGAMGAVFLAGVAELRRRRVLLLMLAVAALVGAFSEGVDRLFVPLIVQSFEFPGLGALDDVSWWGLIAAVVNVFSLVTLWLARRYVDLADHVHITNCLAAAMAAVAVLVVLVAVLDVFAAVLVAYWLLMGLRAASGPLTLAWLNPLIEERTRATLLSMVGQADAVGQVAGGPVLGLIARQVSISAALVTSGAMLAPSIWVYRLMRVWRPAPDRLSNPPER